MVGARHRREGRAVVEEPRPSRSPGPAQFLRLGSRQESRQFEAPLGITGRELLDLAGGIREGHELKFWAVGGSSAPLFTPEHLDVPLDYNGVRQAGSMLATRAIMMFDDTVSVVRVISRWTDFYQHESCGKCTPCREGTGWVDRILAKILAGKGSKEDYQTILDACDMLNGKTICVFAPSVAFIAQSYLKKFKEEFEALIK